MSSLKFGTSGLRGLVTDLVGRPSYAYAAAFFQSVARTSGGAVVIGRDLRASSAGIAATVAEAAREYGLAVVDCGALPTPALALEGMRRDACAVMVTGSHIPDDRNGLKFYRADGEITKSDEGAILAALAALDRKSGPSGVEMPRPTDSGAYTRYRQRYLEAFDADALAGLRVGVYEQSCVARDLLVELIAALGGTPRPFGRSDSFIPIDTEAHRPEDIVLIREAARSVGFDALVTTDGDADRPLMADADGRIVRGDVLGLITARFLGAHIAVVPVTAGSAMERTGIFSQVMRTRVGSPYIIAGMAEAAKNGAGVVVGFESNGGFLLGADVTLARGQLSALPTRDAMLPILSTLATMRAAGTSLADLVASLASEETASDRLPDVPPERSGPFLARFDNDGFVADFLAPLGRCLSISRLDGVRVTLDGNRTIHFRASGNAPELRCYAEAATAAHSEAIVQWGLGAAAGVMG